jgi:hypothetical protein
VNVSMLLGDRVDAENTAIVGVRPLLLCCTANFVPKT